MAAVSVQLSPHVAHSMASRRTPLSNISNAGNSPFRGASASGKRARAQVNTAPALENTGTQPPPSKRQIVEAETAGPITPRRTRGDQRANPATPTQRQHAPRTREVIRTQKPPKQEHLGESMEKLRQWQKHNEKTFPTYVFFFENVPEISRRECSRGVRSLGSMEVPFFSKDVTHIITTRAIPVESDSAQSTDAGTTTSPDNHDKEQPRTIDPAVLDKDRSLDALASVQKSRFTLEASRKPLAPSIDAENRNMQQSDILLRAKSMGIKIWGLDKLKRILDVMFDDGMSTASNATRGKLTSAISKPTQARPQDLQQLISNEQLNGPTDRDAKSVLNDIVTFKGPYVYVRCCFERVKPVMVREWPKVVNREDGEWPQFRSVSAGKCPFVEEDLRPRKPATKDRETGGAGKQAAKADTAPTKRSKPLMDTDRMRPPTVIGCKRPLAELENSSKPLPTPGQQLLPPSKDTADSSRPGTSHGSAFISRSGLVGGEPMASGMQASNVTSAIRSQVISSTAAAPGAKAGTSREMHGLQRKVLARAHAPSGSSLTRSTGMSNLTDASGEVVWGTRAARLRTQSRLAKVMEGKAEEEEPETERADARGKPTTAPRSKAAREKREPKPGFCENCREKFDDFEEHTFSKRHRKFASTKENWAELDNLLSLLGRPQLRTMHSSAYCA